MPEAEVRAKLSPDTNLDCLIFELGDSVSPLMITELIFKKKPDSALVTGPPDNDDAHQGSALTLCRVPVQQRPRPSTLWTSSAQGSHASCILRSAHTELDPGALESCPSRLAEGLRPEECVRLHPFSRHAWQLSEGGLAEAQTHLPMRCLRSVAGGYGTGDGRCLPFLIRDVL